MEKVDVIEMTPDRNNPGWNNLGEYFQAYRASDVDAYRQAVKALVDEFNGIASEYPLALEYEEDARNTWPDRWSRAHHIIAAVDRLGG